MVSSTLPIIQLCILTFHSAVFQAGGLVVVLVEVNRKAYLASIVPVIVNAILNEHQIIVDIVAFVAKGDFPRSRLGEKQRGKILASWVTRKMRTLAQFAIRDLDPNTLGDGAGSSDGPDPNRMSIAASTLRNSGGPPTGVSSLRNVEQAPQILEQEEFEQQMDHIADMPPARPMGMQDEQTTPTGYQLHDGPGDYDNVTTPIAEPHSHPNFSMPHHDAASGPPRPGPKPGSRGVEGEAGMPHIRLPGVDGRESLELWGKNGPPKDGEQGEEDWTADAIMHMNLAGDMGRPQGPER